MDPEERQSTDMTDSEEAAAYRRLAYWLWAYLCAKGWSLQTLADIEAPRERYAPIIWLLVDSAKEVLKSTGSLCMSRRGIKAWEESAIALAHRDCVASCVADSLGGGRDTVTILDLGCGGGKGFVAIEKELRRRTPGMHVEGVLVDIQEGACKDATDLLAERGLAGRVMCNDIGDVVNALDIVERRGDGIAIASESLHELQFERKVDVVRKLKRNGFMLIIAEMEGKHEFVTSRSLELVVAVVSFYGQLIESLVGQNNHDWYGPLAAREFIGGEALQLLLKDYPERGNYHMDGAAWGALMGREGYKIAVRYRGCIGGYCPPFWVGHGCAR